METAIAQYIYQPGNFEALQLWDNVTKDQIKSDFPDLSSRQIAVLTTVYLNENINTVRGLTEALGVSKPAISRAVSTLSNHGLIGRTYDKNDRRNVIIKHTDKGYDFLSSLSKRIMQALADL